MLVPKLSSTLMAGKDCLPVEFSTNCCPVIRWHELLVTLSMIFLDAERRKCQLFSVRSVMVRINEKAIMYT